MILTKSFMVLSKHSFNFRLFSFNDLSFGVAIRPASNSVTYNDYSYQLSI